MRQLKVAVIRIGKALAAGFRAAQRMVAKLAKGTMGVLFGNGQPQVSAMDAADEADEPELAAADNSPEAVEALREKVAQERFAKGLEPEDIKNFALAPTLKERLDLQKLLRAKMGAWCQGLDANQRTILGSAHKTAIEAHMAHVRPIKGLPLAPKMFGKQPEMISPVRPDMVRQVVNDVKAERAREQGFAPKLDLIAGGKELERFTGFNSRPKSNTSPLPTPKGMPSKPFRTSASMSYKPPTPPASVWRASGAMI